MHKTHDHVSSCPIPDDGTASMTTCLAVADEKDVDPLDLPPLADVIDSDALDALADTSSTAESTVSFQYAGYSVLVTAGAVLLSEY